MQSDLPEARHCRTSAAQQISYLRFRQHAAKLNAPSLLSSSHSFSQLGLSLLQASGSRSHCDFEAAFCNFSQCQTHTTLEGSVASTLLLPEGLFLAPAIQCPRIMDRLQPREFNSAPTPFRSEPVSAGCSYNKRLYYSLSNTWHVLNLENWFVLQRVLLRVAC